MFTYCYFTDTADFPVVGLIKDYLILMCGETEWILLSILIPLCWLHSVAYFHVVNVKTNAASRGCLCGLFKWWEMSSTWSVIRSHQICSPLTGQSWGVVDLRSTETHFKSTLAFIAFCFASDEMHLVCMPGESVACFLCMCRLCVFCLWEISLH